MMRVKIVAIRQLLRLAGRRRSRMIPTIAAGTETERQGDEQACPTGSRRLGTKVRQRARSASLHSNTKRPRGSAYAAAPAAPEHLGAPPLATTAPIDEAFADPTSSDAGERQLARRAPPR
jgi:hypothetical protein